MMMLSFLGGRFKVIGALSLGLFIVMLGFFAKGLSGYVLFCFHFMYTGLGFYWFRNGVHRLVMQDQHGFVLCICWSYIC